MKLPDEKKTLVDVFSVKLQGMGLGINAEGLRSLGHSAALVGLLALLVAGSMVPHLFGTRYPVDPGLVGSFAASNYKADRDYEIQDSVTTQKLRQEAAEQVLPVYGFDRDIGRRLSSNLSKSFEFLHDLVRQPERGLSSEEAGFLATTGEDAGVQQARLTQNFYARLRSQRDRFQQLSGLLVEPESFDSIINASLDPGLGVSVANVLRKVMDRGLVNERQSILNAGTERITVRRISDPQHPERIVDVDKLLDLADARVLLETQVQSLLQKRSPGVRQAVTSLVSSALRANLFADQDLTLQRRAAAAAAVKAVSIKVRRGEMILRDGDPFLPRHLLIFRGIQQAQQAKGLFSFFLGVLVLVILLVLSQTYYAQRNLRGVRRSKKDNWLMALLLLTTVLMTIGWAALVPLLHQRFAEIPELALRALAPVAAAPMLVGFLLTPELTLMFTFSAALLAGLAMDASFSFATYAFVSGLLGAGAVARARHRTTLVKAGLFAGLAGALAAVSLWFIHGESLVLLSVFPLAGFALISGLASALVVAGMVPVFEVIFGYVSDFKLLELANLNHPLLRELIMRAPGSYHHSVIVGSLAEAGAEAIGANPLLARVMAYYHDIGKSKNPRYFAENQRDGVNPHDKIAPSMSALVLKKHVKDGLEMARAAKLPEVVSSAIMEHHGNNLIKGFFDKARKAVDEDVETVNEMDYRYAGRRPQSREAALVMIADVVEASARSVAEPNHDRLLGVNQKAINRLFSDAALDESGLTLKDLDAVSHAFLQVLMGIYHERPAYTTPASKERRSDTAELARTSEVKPADKKAGAKKTAEAADAVKEGKDKKTARQARSEKFVAKKSASAKHDDSSKKEQKAANTDKAKDGASGKGERKGHGDKSADAAKQASGERDPEESLRRLGNRPRS